MTIEIIGISLIFMLAGMMVQFRLKSKFNEYSKVATSSGLSGREIAEKMLRDNGIYYMLVISADGFLSDHYDPVKQTINLSADVYEGKNISAAVVSAHECGHAVQHETAYAMLTLTHIEAKSVSPPPTPSFLVQQSIIILR